MNGTERFAVDWNRVDPAVTPLSTFDSFTFVGSALTGAFVPGPNAGPRTNQLPREQDILDFPAAP